jgi:hypothetical protein
MKYICLGYYDQGKHETMTEAEQHAMFDECFEYDDHLRANGHVAAEAALQPPETALTLYWKEGQSRNHGRSLCGNQGTARRHRNPRSAGHESQHPSLKYGSVWEIRPAWT